MIYEWLPVLVLILSVLEGTIEYRAWHRIRSTSGNISAFNIWIIVSGILLNLIWIYFPLPVTLYYILYYLIRLLYGSGKGIHKSTALFHINLGYVNYLVLHLVIIGAAALSQNTSMRDILADPFWRSISVLICTGANIFETAVVLKRKTFSESLNAEAQSEEGRLLMTFLKFSTVYLLLDSLLCFNETEPVYTALFLVGSCVILISVLILYLWYIGKLLQNSRLREENEQLEAELALHDRKTGTLRQMMDLDTMTGAYSRRYGIRQLEKMLQSGQEISIVFIDLDHLKIVNDREGHEAGDRYLIGFVEALRKLLQEKDMTIRLGGDEFMVLMPNCTFTAAQQCMVRIRNAMEHETQAFFFSFGISHCPACGQGKVEELIREADFSMYQDKRRRR